MFWIHPCKLQVCSVVERVQPGVPEPVLHTFVLLDKFASVELFVSELHSQAINLYFNAPQA